MENRKDSKKAFKKEIAEELQEKEKHPMVRGGPILAQYK